MSLKTKKSEYMPPKKEKESNSMSFTKNKKIGEFCQLKTISFSKIT